MAFAPATNPVQSRERERENEGHTDTERHRVNPSSTILKTFTWSYHHSYLMLRFKILTVEDSNKHEHDDGAWWVLVHVQMPRFLASRFNFQHMIIYQIRTNIVADSLVVVAVVVVIVVVLEVAGVEAVAGVAAEAAAASLQKPEPIS